MYAQMTMHPSLLSCTGPAFTLIYVIAGLPLARLADTRSRSLVLLVGVVFWSVMVLLTGFAQVFWQLVLLRIMLGIGEVLVHLVSCVRPSHCLVFNFKINASRKGLPTAYTCYL